MVTSLLSGTKKVTRRLLKCDPLNRDPYGQPGDILWVRETFAPSLGGYVYKTDTHRLNGDGIKWKPGIHMPKKACRIFLQNESISLDRLGEITDEDAILEGIQRISSGSGNCHYRNYLNPKGPLLSPRLSFMSLWISINGDWYPNQLVYRIQFHEISKPQNFITHE